MTSTNFNVGFAEDERNSSRVLKPPGGGCSDIFGSQGPSPQNGVDQPRRVRNTQQSSVFSSPESPATNGHTSPTTPTSNGRRMSDANTQDRLFGTPASEATTPTRKVVDRMKSNIFSEEVDSTPRPASVKKNYVRRNPITGEIIQDDVNGSKTNGHTNGNGTDSGNPITGAGVRDNTTPQQPCVRIRNPPGGHSSGIF